MQLNISARSIVGSKEPQQDSWRVFNAHGEDVSNRAARIATTGDGTLVVVADGIGGYAGGEIASKLACDAFGGTFFRSDGAVGDRLGHALEAANAAIADEKKQRPDLQDMGCTLVGVYFDRDGMTFVSVGDSLLLRSRDQEIHRVNLDHSYFEYLDRQVLGSDDPKKWSLAVHDTRRRASLTLALAGGELTSAEFGHKPQIATRPLLADDVIIIASDGIETLDLVQLQNFMLTLHASGAQGIADGMIRAVDGIGRTRSYQDNTTIVVVAASEGAGLTRVARPAAQATAAQPADHGWTPARMLSFLPAFSPKTATVVGGLVVLLLLLWVFRPDGREPQSPDSKAPKSVETPAKKDRRGKAEDPQQPPNSVTPTPGDPKPTQVQGDPKPDQVTGRQPETGQPPAASSVPATPTSIPTDATSPAQNDSSPAQNDSSAAQNDSSAALSDAPTKPNRQLRISRSGLALRSVQSRFEQQALDNTQCIAACLADTSCIAYTFHSEKANADKRCQLFPSIGRPFLEDGAMSGCVDQTSCRLAVQ